MSVIKLYRLAHPPAAVWRRAPFRPAWAYSAVWISVTWGR